MNIFLSKYYQNKINKKLRVSIPSTFRSVLCKGLIFEIWAYIAFDTHLKNAKALAQSNKLILKNKQNSELGACRRKYFV